MLVGWNRSESISQFCSSKKQKDAMGLSVELHVCCNSTQREALRDKSRGIFVQSLISLVRVLPWFLSVASIDSNQ